MRKTLLLLAVALATFAENAWADKSFKTLPELTYGVAISPSGQYLVGVNPSYMVDGSYSVSYLYDTNTGETQWLTEFDQNDFSKSGEFKAVNDAGVICGASKDPDLLITYSDMFGTETRPANSAAIWKDGKCTLLYYGDFDTSKFEFLGDGSQATDISADSKTVCGYISTGNASSFYPCMWKEGNDGKWTLEWLALPEDAKGGRPYFISDDGKTVVGTITDATNNQQVALWKDGTYTIVTDEQFGWESSGYGGQVKILSMSPNGKFIVAKNPSSMVYLYNIEANEGRKIPAFDTAANIEYAAVDNDGNVVAAYNYGSIFFGGDVYTRPFWYSYKEDRNLDFPYYMQLFASGVTPDFTFEYGEKTQAVPMAISADGNVIVGNIDIYAAVGQKAKCWILKSERYDVSIPVTPSGLSAKSEALGQVTLTWAKDETKYEDLTLKSYNIYRDGEKVANVTADKPMTLTENNVPAGHPGYAVEAVFETAEGGEMLSPKSNILKASVPDTYDMPLFDDFSSNSLETNFWETKAEYGEPTDALWGIMQDYGLMGSSISYMVFSQQPYSGSLISRPLDATKAESVSLSFFMQMTPLNSTDQDLEKDSISVDISTDFGKTWKEIKAWSLKDIYAQYSYNVISLDISAGTTGKIFQLRLRKHGQGVAQYMMYVDNLRIEAGGSGSKAPAGLTGTLGKDGKSLSLMWQNLSGAYQLNYINDPSFINKYTIGNEGKELIAANKFEPEDLAAYKGKYLSGVQTTINYYSTEEEVKGIHASVVVFEDGKMVREQEIKDMTYNEALTVALDEPLLIDGTKELMIGVKIFDYDEQQIPICYIISDKFVAGKSDLYSEDNGASWLKLSEFYNEQGTPEQGYCCWDITGCITDNPELTPVAEGDLFAYNIYRDGEQLNEGVIDRLQTRFTDPEPTEDACYQVVGFFYDGTKSEASEQFCLDDVTGIEHNIADNVTITRNEGDNCLTINGKFDNATLVDISGVCVSRSEGNRLSLNGVKAGIYIISINVDGRVYTQKMIVK